MRVAIVTVSDSAFGVERFDTSGDAIVSWCASRGYSVASRDHVADETSALVPLLVRLCDGGGADLVLTTGGTGLSPRDVTPEATLAVVEREAPGIAEYLRFSSYESFPRAALSRGVAGVRGGTLIANLPGSTSGVLDSLRALETIVDHAIDVLTGKVKQHVNAETAVTAETAGKRI